MGGYHVTYNVTLEGCNGDCRAMASMAVSPGLHGIYFVHSILWWNFLKSQPFSPEVYSWAPVYRGSNRKCIYKEVVC